MGWRDWVSVWQEGGLVTVVRLVLFALVRNGQASSSGEGRDRRCLGEGTRGLWKSRLAAGKLAMGVSGVEGKNSHT